MTVTKAIYQGKGRVEATHVRSAIRPIAHFAGWNPP